MGFGTTLKRIGAYGFKPKVMRNFRRKLGLSGRAKWLRGLKHGLKKTRGAYFGSSPQPTSATNVYQYQGKTLSQLVGGY